MYLMKAIKRAKKKKILSIDSHKNKPRKNEKMSKECYQIKMINFSKKLYLKIVLSLIK